MSSAITVKGLGKRYLLSHERRRDTLRDSLTHGIRGLLRRLGERRAEADAKEEFWAIRDVSFEIERGDVVGIIGRNGAGKSTLLKILSRITEPSAGRASIRGRVASLLEVGTGFHPELTGRENIFLNGAILGMTRQEIRRKFDEIVAFAEVERFLDTPVKHYSSGMYVRLAFAIAAHLEPEILIVDEVLAVGDAAFQQKCIGKMRSAGQSDGRTVLFVSHNMAAVKQLCRTGILMSAGRVAEMGSIADVAKTYALGLRTDSSAGDFGSGAMKGDGTVELLSYTVGNAAGEVNPPPGTLEDVYIRVRVRSKQPIAQPAYGIAIQNEFGVMMISLNSAEQGAILPPMPAGESTVTVKISRITYIPGTYTASFWVMSQQEHIYAMSDYTIAFEISQAPIYGTRAVDHRWGCVYSDVNFSFAPGPAHP
jgi:lipopolysaccharide transport system ATP-binding protein